MCEEAKVPVLLMQVVTELAPTSLELAQRIAEVCQAAEAYNLDELGKANPHELFGLLIQRAHQFIDKAESRDAHGLECLEALKDIGMEVTLFLYHIRKEILNGQVEETEEEGSVQADSEE